MNEKEQAFFEYEKKQAKRFVCGMILVRLIAWAEIGCALFLLAFNLNFQQMIYSAIGITFAVLLLKGFAWVRILYGLIAAFNVILGLAATMVFYNVSEASVASQILFFVAWGIFILLNGAVMGILFFSSSVKEYMYAKRNG